MKQCPNCRMPILAMMFLDGKPVPENYCERYCKSVAPITKPVPATREAVAP